MRKILAIGLLLVGLWGCALRQPTPTPMVTNVIPAWWVDQQLKVLAQSCAAGNDHSCQTYSQLFASRDKLLAFHGFDD